MKPETCPICKNKDNLERVETFFGWDLYGCEVCDAQFWWPLKHPGKEFYEEEYDMVGVHGKNALSWGSKQFLKNTVIKLGKLLDIGCSSGDFLSAVQNKGFDVWGIDISNRSIAAAKMLYDLKNVYSETPETFSTRKDIPKFNVITFFEVIEHIDDPLAFMGQIKNMLVGGGYLAFSTPDRECLGGWHDAPPQHLFKWNERVLRYMLNLHGFKVIKIIREPISHTYFLYRFFKSVSPLSFGIVSWIKERIRSKLSNNIMKSDAAILKNKPVSLKIAEEGAKLKIILFKIIVLPLVVIGRLLRLKWQSIYIIAQYEN